LPETPYGETELRPSTRHASHFPEGTIQTRSARVWLGKDGIVRIQAYSLKREELDDAMANVAAVAKVTGGSKRQLLVDLSSAGPQSHEAREYYMSAESKKNTTAMAIVTGSLLGRIVGNLILGANRTSVPVRLFPNETAALAWLEEQHPPESAPRSR
jgi:hypothetical protein